MIIKRLLQRVKSLLRDTLFQEDLVTARRMLEIQSALLREGFLFESHKYRDPRCLARCLGRVYSQCDEDAIISEIFRRINDETKFFVEIGAGDGSQNTTRLLLETGWSGVWVEGNPVNVDAIKKRFQWAISAKRLKLIESMVTRENVSDLLLSHGIPREPDLLSIDIDMNTSHIWRALDCFQPRVVCVEYNASYPPSVVFEVPYDPAAEWDFSSHFGASLKVLELIGRERAYSLVGCDFSGVNAYFVRDEFADERFLGPFTSEAVYEPARYALTEIQRGHPSVGRRQ